MVVKADAHARLVFDEQQPVMAGSEIFVDHPFQEDAFEPGRHVLSLPDRRNLRRIEMPEQVASPIVQIQHRRRRRDRAILQKEGVASAPAVSAAAPPSAAIEPGPRPHATRAEVPTIHRLRSQPARSW
jgi:hypothetical protein